MAQPTKPILLWKHRTINNAYTLRIAQQKFTGLLRIDRQGQLYWKFQPALPQSQTNHEPAIN